MFELIKESDLDTVRHFYRALAGTEFCAWTDIYPGEPELQSDFSRDSLFCIRDDVSGEIAGLVSIDDDPDCLLVGGATAVGRNFQTGCGGEVPEPRHRTRASGRRDGGT